MWCIEMVDNEPTEIQTFCASYPSSISTEKYAAFCMRHAPQMTMVILPRFEPNEVLDAIERYDQYAYFPAVPTMLEALFANPRVNDIDWHPQICSLRYRCSPGFTRSVPKVPPI